MKSRSISIIFFTGIILVSLSCFAAWNWVEKHGDLPYYGNGKAAESFAGAMRENIKPVPKFSFTDEEGKVIDQDFIDNKVWVANFFFTNCHGICPKMTSQLVGVQKEFSNNSKVKIISFTCDPERDNPSQLDAYSKLYKADNDQWQFATGDKPTLYRFARNGLKIVATDGDGGPDDFIHSENLVLVDKQGYIRGYYDGTDANSVKQLILDIKKLL